VVVQQNRTYCFLLLRGLLVENIILLSSAGADRVEEKDEGDSRFFFKKKRRYYPFGCSSCGSPSAALSGADIY
jgi:hypothetical protein